MLLSPRRLLGTLLACLISAPLFADTHGPICSWHKDPTTSMTVQWIESRDILPGHWFSAPTGVGYGDGDDATVIAMGDHSTVYLRRTFDLAEVPEGAKLILKVRYDDAFIAYLNGTEIARAGVTLDDGELSIASHEAEKFEEFEVADFANLLKPEANVLAIQGFNVSPQSSDFSLHPHLVTQLPSDEEGNKKENNVIPRGAKWNVYCGDTPGENWQTAVTNSPAAKRIPPANYRFEFRKAGEEADGRAHRPWVAASINRRPFADSGGYVHFANLHNLQPDTRYEFRLVQTLPEEQISFPEQWFQTAPAEPTRPVKFVTGGDMFHTRELLDAMNACAGQRDPLFALLGGDLAYANARTANRWYSWFDSWAELAVSPAGRCVPMVVAIGNHETSGPNPEDAKYFYSLFQLPEGVSNYAVDFGDYLSLILLDSNHSQRVAAQTAWLQQALLDRESVPHLYVCYHRPTYGTLVKTDQVAVRTEWVPLFEQHHVSAVFENDHHVYKRTLPIRNGHADPAQGVLYLGDGAWGVSVRKIPEEKVTQLGYMAAWASKNHLIEVIITGDERTYTARTADGQSIDQVQDNRRRAELLRSSRNAP